jgi:hypothetical protein
LHSISENGKKKLKTKKEGFILLGSASQMSPATLRHRTWDIGNRGRQEQQLETTPPEKFPVMMARHWDEVSVCLGC